MNETNKYEAEIDLEMLYKVHEISRHNNFVYIFGAMRSLVPERGCVGSSSVRSSRVMKHSQSVLACASCSRGMSFMV